MDKGGMRWRYEETGKFRTASVIEMATNFHMVMDAVAAVQQHSESVRRPHHTAVRTLGVPTTLLLRTPYTAADHRKISFPSKKKII
jgi:hypothetical protein